MDPGNPRAIPESGRRGWPLRLQRSEGNLRKANYWNNLSLNWRKSINAFISAPTSIWNCSAQMFFLCCYMEIAHGKRLSLEGVGVRRLDIIPIKELSSLTGLASVHNVIGRWKWRWIRNTLRRGDNWIASYTMQWNKELRRVSSKEIFLVSV